MIRNITNIRSRIIINYCWCSFYFNKMSNDDTEQPVEDGRISQIADDDIRNAIINTTAVAVPSLV